MKLTMGLRRPLSCGGRWPIFAEMLLFCVCTGWVGRLYIPNARNFGKPHPAYWGIVVIAVSALLLYAFFANYRMLARSSALVLAAIQVPPIYCWTVFRGTYEFSGVAMVPWWQGFLIHLLFFVWGAANYMLLTRLPQEKAAQAELSGAQL